MDQTSALSSPPPLADIERVALFLDFDGTLVGIAPTPDTIVVPIGLAQRLSELAQTLDGRLALISGRGVDDLERHLGAMDFARAGSHGAARYRADGALLGDEPTPLAPEVIAALKSFAASEGILFEAKPHGGALHYRMRPESMGAVDRFAQALALEHGLSVKHGKQVRELVQRTADKGAAVRAFMAESEFAGAIPVFVGDDVTDEDGIAAVNDLGGFGIVVGEREPTAARYRLASVADVYQWLGL